MMRTAIPAEELLKKARTVGQYYGFTPFAALAAEMRAVARPKEPKSAAPEPPITDPAASVMASFLTQCRTAGLLSVEPAPAHLPLFVWHTNLAEGRAAPRRALIQFHALGTDHALAEAVILRAVIALTADLYRSTPTVRVNSMGDRETRARYVRELSTFFRRRASTLPEECVAVAAKDAFAAAALAIEQQCAESLPLSTEHLSDASRKRFEELLEHLEATDTLYELARDLMSDGAYWNDVCFEVLVEGRRVAWGSRYHELARHVAGRPLPAVGALVEIDTSSSGPLARANAPRTRFAFVHIGDEAKRLSIQLAEEFRRAHLPLVQDIGIESLTEQIRLAERRNPEYLLIMGRKEALEGVAVLRNRATQEETVLPLLGLTERLKAVA